MKNETHSGKTIRELEDQVYKVLRNKGKLLHFPSPVVEVSPAIELSPKQVMELDESPFRSMMRGVFAPMPSWLKDEPIARREKDGVDIYE